MHESGVVRWKRPPLGRTCPRAHRGAALAAPKKNARGGRTLWGLDTAVSPGWGAPLHTCFGGGGRKSISWLTCNQLLRGVKIGTVLWRLSSCCGNSWLRVCSYASSFGYSCPSTVRFSYGAAPPIATRPCRSTRRPQRRAATVAPARGAAMMVGACTVIMRGVHMYHENAHVP